MLDALPRSSSRKTPRTAVLMVRCPCRIRQARHPVLNRQDPARFRQGHHPLAHAGEDKKGENVIVRPDMTGKSKTEAYKVADLMAYMTTEDGRNGKPIKVLEFSPSSSYLAKDSGGWAG